MIPKLHIYSEILLCFVIIGYAAATEVKRTPHPEDDNLDIAINQVFEDIKQQVSQTKKHFIVSLTDFTKKGTQGSHLEKYITGVFKSKLSSSTVFSLLDQTKLYNLLGNMRISLKDLHDSIVRFEFVKHAEIDGIIYGITEQTGDKDFIRINTWIVDLHTGKRIADIIRDVEKDNRIRRFLGEKILDELSVKTRSPHAEDNLNSEQQDTTFNRRSSLTEQQANNDELIDVTNEYSSSRKNIYMSEKGFKKPEVKFEQDNKAPLKCMLASALIPGIGGIFYGSNKAEKNAEPSNAFILLELSAITFYIAGSLYAWDELAEHPDFFSQKHKIKFDRWKNVELFIAIGAYAVNLISAVALGYEYKKRNRYARELSWLKNKPTCVYSIRPINPNGFQVSMNMKF